MLRADRFRVAVACAVAACAILGAGAKEERWVFMPCHFWGKRMQPNSFGFMTNVACKAKAAGYNALALACQLDAFSTWPPELVERVTAAKRYCDSIGIEVFPMLWDISHGTGCTGSWLESRPVDDLQYVRRGGKAVFDPEPVAVVGGPTDGISVKADPNVKRPAMRLHRYVTLKKGVRYVMTMRVKSTGVPKSDVFQIIGFIPNRKGSAYCTSSAHAHDGEWHDVVFPLEAKSDDKVSVFFGHWGRTGQLDVASIEIKPRGICGATRRKGIPFTVKDAETGRVYEEGRDYGEVPPIAFRNEGNPLGPYLELDIPRGSRIREGRRLLVSAEIPNAFFNGKYLQYAGCMSNPEYYKRIEEEARFVQKLFNPRVWFFCFDELRSANSCAVCRARKTDMAHLIGGCLTGMREVVRKVSPNAMCCVWGDMISPYCNAREGYAKTIGSYEGVADLIPKDLIICPWGGAQAMEDSEYWAKRGFKCIAGAYYDDKSLGLMRTWRAAMDKYPGTYIGWMYTTWKQDFSDMGPAMKAMSW